MNEWTNKSFVLTQMFYKIYIYISQSDRFISLPPTANTSTVDGVKKGLGRGKWEIILYSLIWNN